MRRRVRLVSPGSELTVNPGETITLAVEFTYKGRRLRDTLYGVLYAGVEDEISGSGGTAVVDTLEDILEPTPMSGSVVIPVPNRPGETFGIMAKLGNWAKDKIPNVVIIREVPGEAYKDLTIQGLPKTMWMGGSLNFTVMFKYKGPAVSRQLYVAIGHKDTWFNEILWGIKTLSISAATDWSTRLGSLKIDIEPPITPGVYDIYAKIEGVFSPYYLNQITVIE